MAQGNYFFAATARAMTFFLNWTIHLLFGDFHFKINFIALAFETCSGYLSTIMVSSDNSISVYCYLNPCFAFYVPPTNVDHTFRICKFLLVKQIIKDHWNQWYYSFQMLNIEKNYEDYLLKVFSLLLCLSWCKWWVCPWNWLTSHQEEGWAY